MAASHDGIIRVGCFGCRQIACTSDFIACPLLKTAVGVWWIKDLSIQPLQLSGHTKIVTCVCFGNKEQKQLLCSASEDRIHIWNVTKGFKNYMSGCHDQVTPLCIGKELGCVQHVSFNSSDILISLCIEKDVWILNIKTCKLDSMLEGHLSQVSQAEFCPWNEFRIVSIGEDRTFKVWDIQKSCLLYQSSVISGFPFVCLAYDEIQNCIAIGATDGKVRIYDLKEENNFRCLHEMDINQKLAKLMDSTQVDVLSVPKGPAVISSLPKWQKDQHEPEPLQSCIEGDIAEAGTSIVGLFFMKITGKAEDNPGLSNLPFLNTSQVNDIFHVPSILMIGMTASIVMVNCNTWDILHVIDFKDPILSRHELDTVQYTLPMAGLFAFVQQQQQNSVKGIVGSLFHNAIHVINIEIPTALDDDEDAVNALCSRLSQSVAVNTHNVCATNTQEDKRSPGCAEASHSVITVLSNTPLCANSPLKAELVPKSRPAPSKKTSKQANVKGKLQDQPLTFKAKVQSSGYSDSPRSKMFSPKTNAIKKTSVSLKTSSSSNKTGVVTKEYPMDSSPPTMMREKIALTSQPTVVNSIRYSSNGKHIACALANKSVHIIRLPISSTAKETVLTGHDGSVTSVQFNHNDKWLLSSSADRTVNLWSPTSSDPILIFNMVNSNFTDSGVKGKEKENPPFSREITQSSFYYMDKFVLISSGNGLHMYKYHIDSHKDDIKRYQTNSKYKLVKILNQERAQSITCFSCVNSFHSYIVLCCGSNKSIELFDMNVGRSVRVLMDAHTRPVHSICQNQGSSYTSHSSEAYDLFLTAAVTDGIKLWDIRTNRCVRRYEGHVNRSHQTGISVSPCSRYIATGSEDRSVYIFDVRGSSFCHRLTGHTDVVSDVAFHPARPELAAASLDGKMRFYTEEIR